MYTGEMTIQSGPITHHWLGVGWAGLEEIVLPREEGLGELGSRGGVSDGMWPTKGMALERDKQKERCKAVSAET